MHYDPTNWYWIANDGRIYSSSKQSLINKTDKNYVEWQAVGNVATPWPKDKNDTETEAALAEVLFAQGLALFAPTLQDAKSDLKNQIDQQAENTRLKYITPGVGQSMTYQEKVNQAANYSKALAAHLKDPDNIKAPNENEYLLLKSSLGIDGDTLDEVAENITWAYALWEQVGAAIETIRLQTKAAIDTATTVEEARSIFDAVKWP